MRILKKTSFRTKFDFAFIYPTIHDAVCAITDRTYLELNRHRIEEVIKKDLNNNAAIRSQNEFDMEKQQQLGQDYHSKNFDEEYDIKYLSRF